MKALKTLLMLVLVVGVLGGTAYAGGRALRGDDRPSAASPTERRSPATPAPVVHTAAPSRHRSAAPQPSSPADDSASGPTTSPHPTATAPAVLHAGTPLYRPGDTGDDVRAIQARLRQIAWYYGDVSGSYDAQTVTAVKGFQAKREIPVTGAVDQRTLSRLTAMTTTPTDAELHNRLPSPGKLDPRCLTGRVLCVDKTSRTLRWVVDGHVVSTLDARFGSTLNDTPTREGLFHVYLKDADHVSHMYGSSMPFAMFFSGGQAVHYSSDFAAVGYNGASHGCVNIRDYDGIRWLFSQVRVGDKVVVYWS
jgi:peptidoglycan hydrolase-like protein with peptidoglycan-binding domain